MPPNSRAPPRGTEFPPSGYDACSAHALYRCRDEAQDTNPRAISALRLCFLDPAEKLGDRTVLAGRLPHHKPGTVDIFQHFAGYAASAVTMSIQQRSAPDERLFGGMTASAHEHLWRVFSFTP